MKKIFGILILLAVILSYFLLSNTTESGVSINGKVFEVSLAVSQAEQIKGLSGRESLSFDEGMLFVYPDRAERQFWMKDMNFNIDIIWIEGETVVGWVKDVPKPLPNTPESEIPKVNSRAKVDKVLELAAGAIDSLNLQVGDKVKFENIKY